MRIYLAGPALALSLVALGAAAPDALAAPDPVVRESVAVCDPNNPASCWAKSGVGALTATPAGTTNGTPLGAMPPGAIGARLYCAVNQSITFTIAGAQPQSAPTTVTFYGVTSGTVLSNWDENLSGGQMIYVTSGSCLFRWY